MNALQHAGIQATRNLKAQNHLGAWDKVGDFGCVETHGSEQGAATTHQGLFLIGVGKHSPVDVSNVTKGRTYVVPVHYNLEKEHHPIMAMLKSVDVARLASGWHQMPDKVRAKVHAEAFGSAILAGTTATVARAEPRASSVIDDVLGLVSGWDGHGTVAPTSEAKLVTVSVAAYLAEYMGSAEVEVDPSDGGVSFHWHSEDERTLISVDVRPTGKIIIIGTSVDGNSTRATLASHEVGRVLRAAIDAGISHLK